MTKPYSTSAFHVVYHVSDADFLQFLVNYIERNGSPYPVFNVGESTITFFIPSCHKSVFGKIDAFFDEVYQKYKHARAVTELIRLYRKKDFDLDIPYVEV